MTVSSAIERRDLRLDEADIAADFFHRRWRSEHIFHRRRDLLLWQFQENPYAKAFTDGLTFRTAFSGSEVVGAFGYVPFALNLDGQRRYGCHLSNWWVDPEYRQGALALGLLQDVRGGMRTHACIAGMNTPIAESLYEGMSWAVQRVIPRMILPLDAKRFARLLPEGGDEIPQCGGTRPGATDREPTGCEVRRLQDLRALEQAGWDSFYWSRLAPGWMGPAREAGYLHWRYQRIPIFAYQALAAFVSGEIRGIIVYRLEQIQDSADKLLRIVDLTAETAVVGPLLRMVMEEAKRDDALLIDFFCSNSLHFDQLRAHGFVDAVRGDGRGYWAPFLFQPLDHFRMRLNCAWWIRNADMRSDAVRDRFVLMKGDNEFDRPN